MYKKFIIIFTIFISNVFPTEKNDFVEGHIIVKIQKNDSLDLIEKQLNNYGYFLNKILSKT